MRETDRGVSKTLTWDRVSCGPQPYSSCENPSFSQKQKQKKKSINFWYILVDLTLHFVFCYLFSDWNRWRGPLGPLYFVWVVDSPVDRSTVTQTCIWTEWWLECYRRRPTTFGSRGKYMKTLHIFSEGWSNGKKEKDKETYGSILKFSKRTVWREGFRDFDLWPKHGRQSTTTGRVSVYQLDLRLLPKVKEVTHYVRSRQ